jgi:hypothetical protein
MRNLLRTLFIFLAATLVHAHVGSADTYYEGDAGPYHLFVTVRLPQTIPGAGEIQVRSTSPDVKTIQVALLPLTGLGSTLPPAPTVTQRSKDDPQFFTTNLWFLEIGALQVRIEVDGPNGKGELSVPVAAFARELLPMSRGRRTTFIALFLFLIFSIVPVAGVVVRESGVAPGTVPPASRRRRSWIVMLVALIAAAAFIQLNWTWWNSEIATYARSVELLQMPKAETTLVEGNRLVIRPAGRLVFPYRTGKDREVKMDELIPDHGHLMHLFLVASPGMQRLWHLHPDRVEGNAFAIRLPEMPAGSYDVFADILDKTGFPWTLVGKVDLPEITGRNVSGDDSSWTGASFTTSHTDAIVAQLSDGTRMFWERGGPPVKANVPANLVFRVEASDGAQVRDMEPYMGMAAHAEVVSSDMSVFAHIHPSGTVPMAALQLAAAGSFSDTHGMAMLMPDSSSSLPSNFSFAYGFPHPGDYRIFVQIKRAGQVQTAAFDARVQ